MPNGETMAWIIDLTSWINYYDYVKETCGYFGQYPPEYVQDDPEKFNSWVKSQKDKQKNG